MIADMGKDIATEDPEVARKLSEDADDSSNDVDQGEVHASEGTRKVEAMTSTWSKTQLWATFAMYEHPLNARFSIGRISI